MGVTGVGIQEFYGDAVLFQAGEDIVRFDNFSHPLIGVAVFVFITEQGHINAGEEGSLARGAHGHAIDAQQGVNGFDGSSVGQNHTIFIEAQVIGTSGKEKIGPGRNPYTDTIQENEYQF